jgi:protein phosphatase
MGATVALVWLRGEQNEAHLAHMGDSRIYLFRQNHLAQLTEDHSVVALLLKHQEITAEEARTHPARGRLSRFVGMEGEVYPDVQTVNLQGGDRLLICTDGLTGMVQDERVAQLLQANPDPQTTCQALVAEANKAGGEDNVTTVVVNMSAIVANPSHFLPRAG